jgi:hypothetical protein
VSEPTEAIAADKGFPAPVRSVEELVASVRENLDLTYRPRSRRRSRHGECE